MLDELLGLAFGCLARVEGVDVPVVGLHGEGPVLDDGSGRTGVMFTFHVERHLRLVLGDLALVNQVAEAVANHQLGVGSLTTDETVVEALS